MTMQSTDAHASQPGDMIADYRHLTNRRGGRQAFTPEEYQDRVQAVQSDMKRAALDVLLVHTPENICYLTGYETSGYFEYQVLVLAAEGPPELMVRNVEQLNVDEYTWLSHAHVWRDGTDYFEATSRLVRAVHGPGRARVGLEKHSWFVPAQAGEALAAVLKDHDVVDAGRLVETRRLVKSPREQAYARGAAAIADRTMGAASGAARAGATELDVAAAAHHANVMAGGEYPALPHYVSSGARSQLGHASWSEKRLEVGDLLKLEFLGTMRRYHAGLTRAVHVGPAPARIRNQAAIATDLQDQVFDELRPGASLSAVTERARRRLADLGESPIKLRLGYSMGIGFPPIAGEGQTADFREGSPWVLEPGMVFHMLSVISLDLTFSDTVLITSGACERLTNSPRELVEV